MQNVNIYLRKRLHNHCSLFRIRVSVTVLIYISRSNPLTIIANATQLFLPLIHHYRFQRMRS
jgi:hypothetical protein